MAIDKKKWMRWVSVALVLFLGVWSSLFAQLECERPLPSEFLGTNWALIYPENAWNGYVFQLDPAYRPDIDRFQRQFLLGNANRKFKGYLLRDNAFLPATGLNFYTNFGTPGTVPPLTDDANFFPTGISPTDLGGCDAQRSHFGVFLRTRYIVPQDGIYKVTVGSDDGSYMRMFKKAPTQDVLLRDLNNKPVEHINWVKIPADTLNFDGYYNFKYDDNIRNYFVELSDGEEIYIDLDYYEKTNLNELSFSIELYFGGGEIRMNEVLQTDQRTYCAVVPDPDSFYSVLPAVFGNPPNYELATDHQWEYSLDEVSWLPISDATGEEYDIPANPGWGGTHYFRRRAQGLIPVEEGPPVVQDVYSNVLAVTLNTITYPAGGLKQYGTDNWHGYIYKGVARNENDYFGNYPHRFIGKHIQGVPDDLDLIQSFNPNSGMNFVPNQSGGCGFFPDYFSVQFLRQVEVVPGTYRFEIRADDGYRLFIGNGVEENEQVLKTEPGFWNRAGGPDNSSLSTIVFDIDEPGTMFLRLEFYEIANGQTINFSSEFSILPVEWGNISGDACGPENCLNWETVQEKNSSHFVVERSTDAREWTPVGEPVQAQGMSTQLTKYAFRDGAFLSERSYYRIRQVDLDGSVSYSDIIRVDNRNTARQMAPYPNPTTDRLRFYSQGEVRIVHLSSADTRITHSLPFTEVGPQIFEVDLSSYSNSFYVISVITNDSRQSYKVVKR